MSVKVPVTIELKDEAQLGKILEMVEGDAPPANKVDAFVNELVDQVIAGAMVLPSHAVDKLLEINPELDDADKIVEAVETGSGMAGGEMVIRWPVDPALTQPLRDRAFTNGITVQALVKEMMDQATALGYFYDLSDNLRVVFLSREDEREAAKIFGTDSFTSSHIMAAIRKAAAMGATPDDDDDVPGEDEELFANDPATAPVNVAG